MVLTPAMREHFEYMRNATLDIISGKCDADAASTYSHHHQDHHSLVQHQRQRPQVAVIISGIMKRTAPPNGTDGLPNGTHWDHWPGMARHVLDVLGRDADIHSFLCIGLDDQLPSPEVVAGLRVVTVSRNITGTAADTWPKGTAMDKHVSVEGQKARWGRCFEQARQHETAVGAHYSWFVRMRPDLLWFGDIPPLASYS